MAVVSQSSWVGRTAFVTGAGGFVGSWLAKQLVERGARVVCLLLDREESSKLELHGIDNQVEIVRGSVVDHDLVEHVLRESGADSCFHLAAQAIVGSANRSPLPTFETNVRGTWNVLDACRCSGQVERIIVASSDKAYGDQVVLPYTEDLPLSGIYPYDASKACADIVARSFARTYELPIAVTRMANIYGGGDFNASRIVPGTIRSILADEDPLIRSDGTPVRDYLYVEDAVDAYLSLASRLPTAGSGEAFNFGTNSPIGVLDLVNLIIEAIGNDRVKPNVLLTTKIHGEIDRQYLDSTKARSVIGWEAQTPLREGIERTIAWYREHPVHEWV
jgi:CDP-glucose 4,6-dehydratase